MDSIINKIVSELNTAILYEGTYNCEANVYDETHIDDVLKLELDCRLIEKDIEFDVDYENLVNPRKLVYSADVIVDLFIGRLSKLSDGKNIEYSHNITLYPVIDQYGTTSFISDLYITIQMNYKHLIISNL